MLKIYTILFVLVSFLTIFISAKDHNNNKNYYNNTATILKHIYTLHDHCVAQICRNFQYENATEVAFFELKMEVHITDDSTYELSNNQKSYESLTFENSTFTHFPLHLFYTMDIKELDMRNCSISVITWENFLMANNLHVLLLSQNKLHSISEMTFIYAAELQYLFLEDNELSYLVNESFRGLKQLKLLDLSNNRLRDLPTDIFQYLTKLQELRLHDNRLFSIDNDLFSNNTQLFMLTLNNNRLHELGDYAFKFQTRLAFLDISNNRPLSTLVSNVQVTELFVANCTLNRVNIYGAVQHVDLSDNRILELYFSEPEALETLNLRNNALQQMASLTRATNLKNLIIADNPALVDLPEPWLSMNLVKLDMSNTGLNVFPMQSLAELKNLQVLNVSNNLLRDINAQNFQYLENLTYFYIHNNDWNCFNLQLIMEILIKPHGISFTPDTFDTDFPGEYINGIACLYRLEQEGTPTDYENLLENDVEKSVVEKKSEKLENVNMENNVAMTEVEKVRSELQAIVGFYETKFHNVYEIIDELKARLAKFEKLNAGFWDQITVTV